MGIHWVIIEWWYDLWNESFPLNPVDLFVVSDDIITLSKQVENLSLDVKTKTRKNATRKDRQDIKTGETEYNPITTNSDPTTAG